MMRSRMSAVAIRVLSLILLVGFIGSGTAFAQQQDKPSKPSKKVKLAFNPDRLNFGDVTVNGSKTLSVTVTNQSNSATATFDSIMAEPNPPFSEMDDCLPSLGPGLTCTVEVTCMPSDTKNFQGHLVFKFDKRTEKVKLVCNGVSGATPTATATPTRTATATPTRTATATPTATGATATATATATRTATATMTSTGSPTATATGATATATATATRTATATMTSTGSPTATATGATATATPTATGATATATATATRTATATATGATATATATPTATGATATATPTATATGATATATATATPTTTGSATPTLTATATATSSATQTATPTATATMAPGPQAGDVLIAGGDTGGNLGGVVPLATSTISTAGSEIYEALADMFMTVGPLNGSREASAPAVVLPNNKILVVGGSHCFAKTINAASGGPACGSSSFSGFECDALNTAELYDETTSKFTVAGAGSGGHMTTARSAATATLLNNGTVLITGGSTGSSFLSLTAAPTGCGPAGQMSQNTAEIYDPVADTFTATTSIPGCALGTAPPTCTTGLPGTCPVLTTVPIAASPTGATESGTTVTITTTTPHGFSAGMSVAVSGVAVAGYNGSFTIGSVPTSTTFTYTAAVSGLSASGGGAATSETSLRVCGLVDSAALLLNDNTVLIAGGDYLQFLGQSSQQAFIFNPAGATWTQTAPLNVPRELPGQAKLLSGKVLLAGGLTSAAAACVGTGTPPGSTPVAFTSNSSAEVYDPVAHTWTLTTGSSMTPGVAGGMSVPRIATLESFTSGTDSGMVIAAGGVDAETTDGAGTNTFPTCEPVTNITQTTQIATDLFNPTTTAFAPTGPLNQDRLGYASAILNSGTHSGDLVVFGGACGTVPPSLASVVIGTASAGSQCDGGKGTATTDYYEFFNPSTGTWTVGTATTPATPASAPDFSLLP